MKKTMILHLLYAGGVEFEKELEYIREDLEDIANQINKDENNLFYYMRTGENHDELCFCFCGFMFRKEGLLAAQITEGVL